MFEEVRDAFAEPWPAVSRGELLAWTVGYALFLVYASRNRHGFLLVDNANLVVHEAGHALFGWFGTTLGVWGGTILQLLVPLALAASFAYKRQTAAVAFCMFFFFENLLYISVYMGDARAQALPLVSLGGDENPDHDWFLILSQLGVLQQDRAIAGVVRFVGYVGMAGSVVWLWVRGSAEATRA